MKNNLFSVNTNIYLIGIIAAVSGFLFGFDTGIISGAQEFILTTFNINSSNNGFMVASVPIGALIGSIISGLIAKKIGRKKSIILTSILFFLGTIITVLAFSIKIVVLGRLIIGFAIGISSMVVPMYLSEISPAKIRGTIIFYFQLAITIGLLSAFAINLIFYKVIVNPLLNWRCMFSISIIPSIFLFIGMLYMPYSPRYLILKGSVLEAEYILKKLLSKKNVDIEIKKIKNSVDQNKDINWTIIFNRPYNLLLIIAIGLFIFQQLTGINAIMYYGPIIFKNAGFGNEYKFWAQLLIGVTNVFSSLLAILFIDKVGRKPLLLVGIIGIISCLITSSFCLRSSINLPYIALLSILFYVLFFAFSLGGIPYLLMSELFPLKVRPLGMAIASCSNWICNIFISSTFMFFTKKLGGIENVLLLYSIFSFIGFIFVVKFVPETKGKNLEEIEKSFT